MILLNYRRCQNSPIRLSQFFHRYHYQCDSQSYQKQQHRQMRNYHGQRRLPYNFMHCTYCLLYCNGFLDLQEYSKQQERKHRRKIVLPCVIPWEYGSNEYASQKGTAGFGTIRNATTTVKSSRQLSDSNDGVVPWMNCPPLHDKELASQAGLTPFGGIREHAIKVQDREGEKKKDINKLVGDQASEGILKIWSLPNPDAKINQPFGECCV
ncbi:unnamed protein product [Gongylonema pulchrum]|uniref:ZM domain-containing protein n=1 Tax=Gongylonema pulchrum TaxID=637853 RepID=A0A183EIE2_9BILA|nr:unnamed protein product [Gongylonema pulchrum]